jgi:DTW domain-containing protein YfiP
MNPRNDFGKNKAKKQRKVKIEKPGLERHRAMVHDATKAKAKKMRH